MDANDWLFPEATGTVPTGGILDTDAQVRHMPMAIRAFRIPDDLWFVALALANERDEVLSKVIRKTL